MTSITNELPDEHTEQTSSSSDSSPQPNSNHGDQGTQTKPAARPKTTFGHLVERERVLW